MHKKPVSFYQFIIEESTIRIIDVQQLKTVWHFPAYILLQVFRLTFIKRSLSAPLTISNPAFKITFVKYQSFQFITIPNL